MGITIDFKFIGTVFIAILKALPVTLEITGVSILVGLIIGILTASVRIFKVKGLKQLAEFYVSFTRGTPMLMQLLIVYYAIPQIYDYYAVIYGWTFKSYEIPILVFALIAFSINTGAYMSEVIRSGIMAVEKGQFEACYSVGMTIRQTMTRVVLPQALGISIPMITSMLISLLKGTSIAFTISILEVTGMAKATAATNYNFLEAYLACAILYWGLSMLVERVSEFLEKRVMIYSKGGFA